MEYLKMTQKEINEIIRKGGTELSKLNKLVSEHLEGLKLSKYSKNIINNTDYNCIADVFNGLYTVEEVENFIINYYLIDEVLDDVMYIISDKGSEDYIDLYINDIVRNKCPEYSEEQYKSICDEVEKRYNRL